MSITADRRSIPARRGTIAGLARWRMKQEANAAAETSKYPPAESIFASLPRRERLIDPSEGQQAEVPVYRPLTFETSWWRSLRRLITWLRFLVTLVLGTLFDKVRRQDTVERRAVRLREALEHAGGTFVKLGQQISMRIDLVPWAVSIELAKMLDRMPPFPVEEALEAVERTAGRPWDEIFSVFDPEPIGSASMACVYQATLMDGTKVAVKVRRPEIGELFMADFWVLDRLAELAEFLTFFRPGFSRNLRAELRDTLLEELDFRREGRFQDIFRRHAPKSGKTFFTAPKVYFEWSGEEVLVQEFVSGYWLWEIVGVVENGSPGERAMLQRLNIDPKEVARRLLWAVFWSMEEDMFFHADPHPANILVRPNSELTFIDFGSCGSFNYEQKAALEQIVVAMQNKDVEGMVRAATELLEPLPPMDVPEFLKMAETEFMHVLNTFNTPAEYTEWWERTTARQWISLVRVARKFNLPLSLHMLRMIRATLLYDTIVLRLDRRVDRYSEYALFMKERVKFVRKRWRKRLRDSGSDGFYLRLDELADGASDLMLRAQKVMTTPIVTFGPTVDKWIFSVTVLSRMVGRILIVTLLTMGIVEVVRYGANEPSSPLDVLQSIFDSRYYQIFIVGAVVLNIRQILFRLREREVGNN